MKKIFLDSSVLVAACASKTGASAFILGYCRQKKLESFVSLEIIEEARKNVNLKLGSRGKKRLIGFMKLASLQLVSFPLAEEIVFCEQVICQKDAPILAAAMKSPADFLITLDRKDFLKPKVIEFAKRLKIMLPGEFVKRYLKRLF